MLQWAIAVIAVCVVVPFTVPRLLDLWERHQDARLHRAHPSERRT